MQGVWPRALTFMSQNPTVHGFPLRKYRNFWLASTYGMHLPCLSRQHTLQESSVSEMKQQTTVFLPDCSCGYTSFKTKCCWSSEASFLIPWLTLPCPTDGAFLERMEHCTVSNHAELKKLRLRRPEVTPLGVLRGRVSKPRELKLRAVPVSKTTSECCSKT